MIRGFLKISRMIDRAVIAVADLSAWVFIFMMLTILVDVITRKFGFQIPGLGSTRLQELEWHFHVVLYALWMGANYIKNAHVRVDVAVEKMSTHTRTWIELIGIVVLALPFMGLAVYFAFEFAATSFIQQEGSSSPTGLGQRWIIKSVLAFGLLLVAMAVISKLLRCLIFLFGDELQKEQANVFGRLDSIASSNPNSSAGSGT